MQFTLCRRDHIWKTVAGLGSVRAAIDRRTALHRALRPRSFGAVDRSDDLLRPKGRERLGAILGDPDFVPLRLADRERVVGSRLDREHAARADLLSAVNGEPEAPGGLVPRVHDLMPLVVSCSELKRRRHRSRNRKVVGAGCERSPSGDVNAQALGRVAHRRASAPLPVRRSAIARISHAVHEVRQGCRSATRVCVWAAPQSPLR